MFKNNVGSIDRIVRVLIGLVLIGLTLSGTIGVWGWIGVVPLATGLIGWCPAYTLLGINTCPMKTQSKSFSSSSRASRTPSPTATTRPSRDVSYDGRRLVCKPLSGKVPPQRLVLAASASVPLSPAAEAFVQVAREHLAAAG